MKSFRCLWLISFLALTCIGCEPIHGLGFSPYEGDQDPNLREPVPREQIERKLARIAPFTTWVRDYGSDDGLEITGAVAHDLGLKMAKGAWLGPDSGANDVQLDLLIAAAERGEVDLAVVGSEVLLRGDLTPAELIDYIERFKLAVPGIPVATADVWFELRDHPDVVAACDELLLHFYPFWEGIPVEHAIWKLHSDFQQFTGAGASQGKPIHVGESGWPSAGQVVGQAIPSPANAAFHFMNFVSWAEANDVPYFYFEAYDEPWKANYEGPVGAHWGIFRENGSLKPGMERVFRGERTEDNWSGAVPGGEGEPELVLTRVPRYNTFDDLEGRVWHVATDEHRIVVYIFVTSWWVKPFENQPTTLIRPDGTWTTDITTGGIDQLAVRVAAFLIPETYDPPALRNAAELPQELFDNALDWKIVERPPE